jgi:two-component system chemotaxis response regulator CheB
VAEPKIRVLIVDESAIVRKILSEALAAEPDIEVVATAPDPIVALEKIRRLKPDVLTLDIEMPRMDGLTFLKLLMKSDPLPVILISSLAQSSCETALEGLRLGAVDVLGKPSGPYSVGELRASVVARIHAAARAKLPSKRAQRNAAAEFAQKNDNAAASCALHRPRAATAPPSPAFPPFARGLDGLVAIGASTGGVEAITTVLTALPEDAPPILITQHIPAVFSRAFADRLNRLCRVEVREARDGDGVKPGLALVAPGGFHMLLTRIGGEYRVSVKDGPQVCYQRPSVDVLFASVAEIAGSRALGVILTGMGHDGAQGLKSMKQRGARTLAQDEESCVVFGMPKEAIRAGAVDQVLPLERIAGAILLSIPGDQPICTVMDSPGRERTR